MSFSWDLSAIFVTIRLELWTSEVKTIEVKCHFHHVISRYILSTEFIIRDVNSDHLAKEVFVRCLHCKVTLYFDLHFVFHGALNARDSICLLECSTV